MDLYWDSGMAIEVNNIANKATSQGKRLGLQKIITTAFQCNKLTV